MGLDFRIEESAKVYIRELTGDNLKDGLVKWEESDLGDVQMILEEAPYGIAKPMEFRIEPSPEIVGVPADYPHWSYGGFGRFRERLFTEAGAELKGWPRNLRMMQGFRPMSAHEIYALRYGYEVATINIGHWESFVADQERWWSELAFSWEDLEPSPIIPLLNHSDCEGDLEPEVCATVAPELRRLIQNWGIGEELEDYDKRMASALADYMNCAAANHRRLIFC